MTVRSIDIELIRFFRQVSEPVARAGLFIVFFWFGFLKVIDLSPATPLVQQLFEQIIYFMPFTIFIVLFGLFECFIGILFIIKGAERIVIPLLSLHMITTFVPLFVLSQVTWSSFLVPTLVGQYIIKNIVVVAVAMSIAAHLHPLSQTKK